MKMRSFLSIGLMAAALLTVAGAARADAPCRGYTRTVTLPDGSARLAAGTACLAADGVWRVADEHLVRNNVAAIAAAPPVVYSAGYYGPPPPYYYAPYPYYSGYYGPYYPAAYFSFGFHDGFRGGRFHHWR